MPFTSPKRMTDGLTGLAAVMAIGAMSAHENGMARMRAGQEARASQILHAQLRQAQQRAFDIASFAEQQVRENSLLKEENRRLEKLLRKRQEMIDAISTS